MKGTTVLLLIAFMTGARSENLCPSELESNWEIKMLLQHDDCNRYYKCIYGQPVEYTCPPGLYFNLELWLCDSQENVDCKGRNDPALSTLTPPSTTTTQSTITTTTPTTTSNITTTTATKSINTTTTPTTTTPYSTTITPNTTTTTRLTNTTTTLTTTTPYSTTITPNTTTTTQPTNTTTTTTTPSPTTIAPNITTTAEPTNTTNTTTTTTTSPTTIAPNTTTTTTTTTSTPTPANPDFLPNGCPVNPHIHWLLPHEQDCNLFYYCVWGQRELRQCPSSLHFNPVLQVCDWQWDAGCRLSYNKHDRKRRSML